MEYSFRKTVGISYSDWFQLKIEGGEGFYTQRDKEYS